jgi:RNA polymerase sigma-70 factor (ECF subfamily)
MAMTTATTAAATAATEGATASRPDHRAGGRPDHEAAAARTEALYRDHGRLVGGLCRALLRDRAEGEDAAQQVFLAAHRALLNGTSPREPAAWLATIARNECWARIRARMREPLPTAEIDGARSLSDPLAEALRNADLAALWAAVAELPRQQREALLLREFGGLSYEELAAALAVSGSAVESLLFRARQGLRTRLETVYAALSGASLLETLGRLAGGIGGGMAPAAAKVAVVGVGAAVATSGAVVTPRLLEHGSHAQPVRHTATAPARPIAVPDAAVHAPAVVLVARRATPAAATPRRRSPGKQRHGGTSGDDRANGDDAETGSSGKDGGRGDDASPVEAATTTVSGAAGSGHEGSAAESGDGTELSSDGEGSHSGSDDSAGSGDSFHGDGDSTSGSGDGDSGHRGSGGGGSSDDGGVVTTTTNQIVTVIAPTEDEPPTAGAPGSGGGG